MNNNFLNTYPCSQILYIHTQNTILVTSIWLPTSEQLLICSVHRKHHCWKDQWTKSGFQCSCMCITNLLKVGCADFNAGIKQHYSAHKTTPVWSHSSATEGQSSHFNLNHCGTDGGMHQRDRMLYSVEAHCANHATRGSQHNLCCCDPVIVVMLIYCKLMNMHFFCNFKLLCRLHVMMFFY